MMLMAGSVDTDVNTAKTSYEKTHYPCWSWMPWI